VTDRAKLVAEVQKSVRAYQPSRKLGSLLGGGAAYCGGAITGESWYGLW